MPYLAQSGLTPILDEDQVPEPPQNYIPGSTYVPPVGAPVEAVGAGAPVPEPVVVEPAPYIPSSTYDPAVSPSAYQAPAPAPTGYATTPPGGNDTYLATQPDGSTVNPAYTDPAPGSVYVPVDPSRPTGGMATYVPPAPPATLPAVTPAAQATNDRYNAPAPVTLGGNPARQPVPGGPANPDYRTLGAGARGRSLGQEFGPIYALPANTVPEPGMLPATGIDNWAAPPINRETPIQDFPQNVIQSARTIAGGIGNLLFPAQPAYAEDLEDPANEGDQLPRPVTGGFRGSTGGGRGAPTGGGGRIDDAPAAAEPVVAEPAPTTPRPATGATTVSLPTAPGTPGSLGGARTGTPGGTGFGAPETPPTAPSTAAAPVAAAPVVTGGITPKGLAKGAILAGAGVAAAKAAIDSQQQPPAPTAQVGPVPVQPGDYSPSTNPSTAGEWTNATTRSLELMKSYSLPDWAAKTVRVPVDPGDGVPRKLIQAKGVDGLYVGYVDANGNIVPVGNDTTPEDFAALVTANAAPAPDGWGDVATPTAASPTAPSGTSGTSGGTGTVATPSSGGSSSGSSGGSRTSGGSGSGSSGGSSEYGYDHGSRSSGGSSRRSFDDTADYQREFTADDFLEMAGGDRKKAAFMARAANKRRRSKGSSSRGRSGGMFWEGFPFNRPPTPIRQHILDALATSRNKTR